MKLEFVIRVIQFSLKTLVLGDYYRYFWDWTTGFHIDSIFIFRLLLFFAYLLFASLVLPLNPIIQFNVFIIESKLHPFLKRYFLLIQEQDLIYLQLFFEVVLVFLKISLSILQIIGCHAYCY